LLTWLFESGQKKTKAAEALPRIIITTAQSVCRLPLVFSHHHNRLPSLPLQLLAAAAASKQPQNSLVRDLRQGRRRGCHRSQQQERINQSLFKRPTAWSVGFFSGQDLPSV